MKQIALKIAALSAGCLLALSLVFGVILTFSTAAANENTVQLLDSTLREDFDRLARTRGEMRRLSNITTENNGGMSEISIGAVEINQSINEISELGVRNKDLVEKLNAETSRFKVQTWMISVHALICR